MKLTRLALFCASLAIATLTGGVSTSAYADPAPPTIIVHVDQNGYRWIYVCNGGVCVLQDHYWTGEKPH